MSDTRQTYLAERVNQKIDGDYYVVAIDNISTADAAVDVGLEMFWHEEDGA